MIGARLSPGRPHVCVRIVSAQSSASACHSGRAAARPTSLMPRTVEAQFYQLYFQEPGVAEAEFEKDPRATMQAMLYRGSGEGVAATRAVAPSSGRALSVGMVPRADGGCHPAHNRCRHGSAKPTSVFTLVNLRAAVFAVLSTTINIDRNWE